MAVANQFWTLAANSSVIMPARVTITNSSRAGSPAAIADFSSPFKTDANGSWICHFGCWGASCRARSKAKNACPYRGYSTQRVPSLSKTAVRSLGGRKDELFGVVMFATKPRIASLATPSFQETRGSVIGVNDCGCWLRLLAASLLHPG